MPRQQGLRPIGDSIKKIIERIKKEREERRKKGKPIRTQPKLPGMMSGGMGLLGRRKKAGASEPKKKEKKTPTPNQQIKKRRLGELKKELGMKKGGKITQKDIDKTEEGVMIVLEKKANGGITGKSTMGQLKKKYGSLKKGIRLKGKGSSFMKEYKKRVYNKAGGGSMNGGVRGTGIAIKGTNFKGVF